MADKLRPIRVRAEGSTLTLQPVLRNRHNQILYVARNPSSWRSNYSVWVDAGRGWGRMLVSHHKTRALATTAARRLRTKDVLHVLGWR